MNKQQLRTIYRQKRTQLSAPEKLKLDDLLLIQLQRLPFNFNIETVMSFWPFEQHGEVNTHLYIRYLEHAIPHLKVAFPVIDLSLAEMHAVLADDDTEFRENKYGIPEPVTGEEVPPEKIDLVFVPLLAFDLQGFRVGYGKGYYDRFLKKCSATVTTIGFSWFDAEGKIEDTDEFDVPLNYCITPYKIYEF